MGKSFQLKCWRALILFGFYVFLCSAARAEVNFVQITDPHIFDDVSEADDSRLDNKAALASCIERINRMAAQRGAGEGPQKMPPYDFVVVTGDLGIAQLLKGVGGRERENRIIAGAMELASVIGLSKVQTWLFVPGDSDLLDEKPENISHYYAFIAALREAVAGMKNKIDIIDLCAEDSAVRPYRIRNYAFIGFNNASFRNSGPAGVVTTEEGTAPIDQNFDVQMRYAALVNEQLTAKDITHAYIFYHIPEVDDPSLVTLKEDEEPLRTRSVGVESIGGSYVYSAWFVKREVRAEWNKAVLDSKVEGLFAGHFHDNKKDSYQNFKWLRMPNYLHKSLTRLHVCPPLALKLQKGKVEQARGFQEVNIAEDGKVSARIFWLEPAGWSLDAGPDALDTSSLRHLEIGRIYEGLDRLREAEAAYAKAAESNWEPTREHALGSMRRVAERQDSALDKNVASPLGAAWVAGFTALSTAAITAALTLVLMAVLLWALPPVVKLWKWYWKRKGRKKLKIGPVADSPKGGAGPRFEQLVAMVHRRLQTHFRPRKTIKGNPTLPLVATSLSADVAELVEAAGPGGVGKYVAWLLKQREQAQYSVEGVMQSNEFGHQLMFVSLNEDSRLLKTWHQDSFGGRIIADERKLAFDAMKRLVRHMNK